MKLMKKITIGLLFILPKSMKAADHPNMVTEKIQVYCKGNRLVFQNTDLLEYSDNKFTEVEKFFKDEIQCQENQKYIDLVLKNSKTITILLNYNKQEEIRYLNYSKLCSGEDCQIDVLHLKNINLNVEFLGFDFTHSVEEYLRKTTIHWDSETCPPWAPDCDL